MKLKSFLDKYDTVIFDMDGVITSEQNYWNAAALTVWETLADKSHAKIDTEYCMRHLKEIRGKVFCGDELISVLKSKGVNSNWDLGYVTVLIAWITKGDEQYGSFRDVLEYAKTLPDNIIDAYDALAQKCCDVTGYDMYYLKRNGELWQEMHELFQEWFLGDELRGKMSAHGHKAGLLYKEEPIVDKDKLIAVLKLLSETKRVCTGTGRPRVEMLVPLSDWKVIEYFAADGLCNYDHVANAEKTLNNNALTKPNPYMFLKALYGTYTGFSPVIAAELCHRAGTDGNESAASLAESDLKRLYDNFISLTDELEAGHFEPEIVYEESGQGLKPREFAAVRLTMYEDLKGSFFDSI